MTLVREPIYLRVPPGHEKHWDRYCRHYGACGQPVYFVQDRWYRDVYAPRYDGGKGRRDAGRDGHHDKARHGRKENRSGN